MSPHQPKLAEQLKKMHTLDRYTAESRVENLKMDLGYIKKQCNLLRYPKVKKILFFF